MFLILFVTFLDIKNDTENVREDTNFLGKLQGGLKTTCVKFGNPAPRFEGPTKKTPANFQSKMKKILSIPRLQNSEPNDFMSKKMSLDELGRRQNPI